LATAREIAIEVLPHFAKHVLAGTTLPYGAYAHAIGRDPAKESMVVGQAMHLIGAVCVLTRLPVAPLHFVERADGEWRGVFHSDSSERTHVLPHYDLLLVTARIHRYVGKDFRQIDRVLREVLPKHLTAEQSSPHHAWHVMIYNKLPDSETTLWEHALAYYRELFSAASEEWRTRRG